MEWTAKPPNDPGYYWCQPEDGGRLLIAQVYDESGYIDIGGYTYSDKSEISRWWPVKIKEPKQ